MDLILLELTLYQLNRSTQNGFDAKRKQAAPRMNLTNVKYTPTMENGKQGLTVTSDCISGDSGNHYKQVIVFQKVKLLPEDSPQARTFEGPDGQPFHVDNYSLQAADVKVRCNCLDFYWRFTNFNFKQRALQGDPNPPYVRKTNRPPVNPMQKPGICKHIYQLLKTVVPDAYQY
jgi:hypothetical protein